MISVLPMTSCFQRVWRNTYPPNISSCLIRSRAWCYTRVTLTSDVSRWQFFQDRAIDENSRLGWSNLPPCRAKNMVVNGSWKKNAINVVESRSSTCRRRTIKEEVKNRLDKSATYDSNQPIEHERRRRVMCAVVKRRNALVFPGTVSFLEVRFSAGVQRSDGLWARNKKHNTTCSHAQYSNWKGEGVT